MIISSVSQAQQQWREYADVERAQLHVLLQQWNRVEREMEGSYHVRAEREKAKQAIMSKSLFYEGRPFSSVFVKSKTVYLVK